MNASSSPRLVRLVPLAATLVASALALAACTVSSPGVPDDDVDGGGLPRNGASDNRYPPTERDWNDGEGDVDDGDDGEPIKPNPLADAGPATTRDAVADAPVDVPDARPDVIPTRDAQADAEPSPAGTHPFLVGLWRPAAPSTTPAWFRQLNADGSYAETMEASRFGRWRAGDTDYHIVIEVTPVGAASPIREFCTYAISDARTSMSIACRSVGYPAKSAVAITAAQPAGWTKS